MDFRTILGLTFDDLPLAGRPHVSAFDDDALHEGSEPRWSIRMADDSLSLWLTKDRLVSTIFLHAQPLIEAQLGLSEPITLLQVLAKFGVPSRSGEAQSAGFLGPRGAWLRYDSEGHSLHIEFRYKAEGVHGVTLMRHSEAP